MTWESQNQSQHINQLRLILNFIFGQLPLVKIKQFKLKLKKKTFEALIITKTVVKMLLFFC